MTDIDDACIPNLDDLVKEETEMIQIGLGNVLWKIEKGIPLPSSYYLRFKEIIKNRKRSVKLIITKKKTVLNADKMILSLLLSVFVNHRFNILKEVELDLYLLPLEIIPILMFYVNLTSLSLSSVRDKEFLLLMYCLGFNSSTFDEAVKGVHLETYEHMQQTLDTIKRLYPKRVSKLSVLKINWMGFQGDLMFKDLFIESTVHVLKTNPFLREIQLPRLIINEELILEAMDDNYTLLKTNSNVNPNTLIRNNFLYDETKSLAITFLVLRQRGTSILSKLDKRLISFIAQLIWNLRHDNKHLQTLDHFAKFDLKRIIL